MKTKSNRSKSRRSPYPCPLSASGSFGAGDDYLVPEESGSLTESNGKGQQMTPHLSSPYSSIYPKDGSDSPVQRELICCLLKSSSSTSVTESSTIAHGKTSHAQQPVFYTENTKSGSSYYPNTYHYGSQYLGYPAHHNYYNSGNYYRNNCLQQPSTYNYSSLYYDPMSMFGLYSSQCPSYLNKDYGDGHGEKLDETGSNYGDTRESGCYSSYRGLLTTLDTNQKR